MVSVVVKRLLLLTGSPGVGKTTVLLQVVDALKAKGYSVGGIISREVRSCGERVGFEILDLSSGKYGWLAHVNQKTGPRIGKYLVNLEDLESIGAKAIVDAAEGSDVVVIDEIGPMELFSVKFKEAVRKAVNGKKLVVGIIHLKAKDILVDEVKGREDAEPFTVELANRSKLHELIIKRSIEFLGRA
jgi:nucleoside-triphosphatase